MYGPHVTLVQEKAVVLNTLIVIRSNRPLISIYYHGFTAEEETEQRRESALRAWRTVVLHSRADDTVEADVATLSRQMVLVLKNHLSSLDFGLGSGMPSNSNHFAATARSPSIVGLLVASIGY